MLIVCNGLMLILLFLIACKDVRERRIPNAMLGILLACVVICRVVSDEPVSTLSMITGSLSIALFLLSLTWIRPGSFGLGDVKLMLVAGIHLGIRDIWYAFAIGIFGAAVFCAGGLLVKKLSMKSEIAFGPFLCLGIMIMILVGL